MIAEKIYHGATREELGIGELQYQSRLDTVNNFLNQWTGNDKDFKEDFLKYLIESNKNDHLSDIGVIAHKEEKEVSEKEKLTYGEMFKDLYRSIKAISKSGMELSTNEEHKRRYNICLACEYLSSGGRCGKCGCFMKLKSKYKVMSCPINLWKIK